MRGSKTFKGILAVLVSLAVLVAVLPLAARYYGAKWLQGQGATGASIESVSLNFLSGIITVQNLSAGDRDGQTLRFDELVIDPTWLELLKGHPGVDSILLKDAIIDIELSPDGAVRVGALTFASQAENAAAESNQMLDFSVGRIDLEAVTVSFSDTNIAKTLHIDSLALGSLSTAEPGRQTSLAMTARPGDSGLTIKGDIVPFDVVRKVDLEITARDLQLAEHKDVIPALGLEGLTGTVSLTTTLRLLFGAERLEADVEGTVTASDLHAKVAGLDTVIEGVKVDVRARFIERAGLDFSVQVGLEADGISAGISGATYPLAQIGHVDIVSADISGARATVGSINLAQLVFLQQYHEPGNSVDSIALAGIEVQFPDETIPASVAIDDLNVVGATLYVARSDTGRILYTELPADLAAATATSGVDVPQAESVAPMVVRIGRLAFEQASLEIHDFQVNPALALTLQPVTLKLENLDSSQPDNPLAVDLSIAMGEFTRLTSSGRLTPLAAQPAADLKFEITGLELPRFAAYLPGYDINRGRLAASGTAKINEGKLDVANDLVLEDLRLASRAGQEVPALSTALSMPLDVALDLLRNSNDEIRLSIPVTGDIASPQFDLDDVMSSAIGGAMQKAAFSYVKSLLQPLGTILFVADVANKAARPRFEPVAFPPGSAELTDRGREYLGKVATLLNDRPGLTVSACGVATPADTAALLLSKQAQLEGMADPSPTAQTAALVSDAEITALANARGDIVRSFLVKEAGLPQARVFACSTAVEDTDERGPRAKLLL